MGRFLVLAAAFVVVQAQAKVTIFSHQQVLDHALASKQLKAFQASGKSLEGLELTNVAIERNGGPGLGTTYELKLHYANVPYPGTLGLLTACDVEVTVNVEKAPAPPGITASQLGKPIIPDFTCAE